MEKNFTGIDTKIYGAPETPYPLEQRTVAPALSTPAPAKVGIGGIVQSSELNAQADAVIAENNREKAGPVEAFGAAVSQWLPVKLYENLTMPVHPADPNFSSAAALGTLKFIPTAEQRTALIEKSSGPAFYDAVERMERQAEAQRAMGDSPIAGVIGGMVDPGYLLIDTMGLGVGRVANALKLGTAARRLTVGASVTAATYAVESTGQEYAPIAASELWTNALLNGAITGLVSRGGKLVKADPEFPSGKLYREAKELEAVHVERAEAPVLQAEAPQVFRATTPVSIQTGPRVGTEPAFAYKAYSAKGLLQDMAGHIDPLVGVLAKRLDELLPFDIQVRATAKRNLPGRSRPYYDPQTHAVYVAQDTPQHVQLHEITHAATVHKIQYGLTNPNTVHGAIVRDIQELHVQAQETYKAAPLPKGSQAAATVEHYLSNLDEFVAGAFSGKSEFTDLLSNMKSKLAKGSVLSNFVDSVRRLLGMKKGEVSALTKTIGLTEKLIGEKLNVTLKGTADEGLSIRLSAPELDRIHTKADAAKTIAQKLAHKIEWSAHKTMAALGTEGKRVADVLLDDALNMGGNSVENIQRAVHADLVAHQYGFEDALMKYMGTQGYGSWKGIFKIGETTKFKASVEKEVGLELLRRDRLVQDGIPVTHLNVKPHIKEMADIWDAGMKAALDEMKRAGVHGSENILEKSGYFSRRWDISRIEGIEGRLMDSGLSRAEAQGRVRDALSVGIQRANGWDASLAQDVASAILNRTRAKGYFEDTIFHKAGGADDLAALKVMLSDSGVVGARAQRILDVMGGKVDEVGKMSSMKHRIDVAMDEGIRLADGSEVRLQDMLDMNLTNIMDGYMRASATQAAFARKGAITSSDVSKLRGEFLHGIDNVTERAQAQELFDDVIASLKGQPVGERVPEMMRNMSAVTQMIALSNSALWQVIESMTTLAHYGAGRASAAMFKELPIIRTILDNVEDSTHLKEVLTRNASQDIRLRPFINKMEDGFELPVSAQMTMALNQAKQYVPYINGMKYIQKHQARTVANLIVGTLSRAAKGDVKATEALAGYGLESHVLKNIQADIATHGMDTSAWTDATWEAVRAPLTKMMDDSVIRARRGELPAFVQHSSVGKFMFTFRTFQLASHNKVLAKTLNTGGFQGVGLLALYQMPMAVVMTAVANSAAGKKPMTDKELVAKSFGQISTLGMFSDILGIVSGTKTSMGSPATMALDRAAQVLGSTAKGDFGGAAGNALQLVPLLALPLPIKNIGQHLKE